jgi:hypothetical protein
MTTSTVRCRRVSGVQRGVKGMDLDAKVASVDIVTEKQVSRIGGAHRLEQFHEAILPIGQFTAANKDNPRTQHIVHGYHHRLG